MKSLRNSIRKRSCTRFWRCRWRRGPSLRPQGK